MRSLLSEPASLQQLARGGISIAPSPRSQQVVSYCFLLHRRPQFETFLCLEYLTCISQSPRHCTDSWSLPGKHPKPLSRRKRWWYLDTSVAAQGGWCMESTPSGLSLACEIGRLMLFCRSWWALDVHQIPCGLGLWAFGQQCKHLSSGDT